jgi:predicted enzyme related to lactoylglutathione lyase
MVKVESADATARRVTELGGKAMPPFDVFDAGRMAVCFDPDGANIDVWEPKAQPGTDVDPTVHGAPSWFEVTAADVPRATAFYSRLFGWQPQAMPVFNFTYTTFSLGADQVAGMMPILPEMAGMKPAWSVYFTVTDTDAVVRNARTLGGSVFLEPHDIPDVGRSAGIASPQGVAFYVITYAARPAGDPSRNA